MDAGAGIHRSMKEQFRYKNLLQEFAQRSAIPLPVYRTESSGSQHVPQFISTVVVNGTTFRTSCAFPNKKAAEQEVAKVALEGISKSIKNKTDSLIHNDTIFCKSILYEYAVKMNLARPTYETSQSEGLLPIFVSSVVFDGKNYLGGGGKNKKEAEQIAARTVIVSILGNSETRNLLLQIIKSKDKLYAAMHKGDILCLNEGQDIVKEEQGEKDIVKEGRGEENIVKEGQGKKDIVKEGQGDDIIRNTTVDLETIMPHDKLNDSLPVEGENKILSHSLTVLTNSSQNVLSNKKRSRRKKKKQSQQKRVRVDEHFPTPCDLPSANPFPLATLSTSQFLQNKKTTYITIAVPGWLLSNPLNHEEEFNLFFLQLAFCEHFGFRLVPAFWFNLNVNVDIFAWYEDAKFYNNFQMVASVLHV